MKKSSWQKPSVIIISMVVMLLLLLYFYYHAWIKAHDNSMEILMALAITGSIMLVKEMARLKQQKQIVSDTHGSAHFASEKDILATGLLSVTDNTVSILARGNTLKQKKPALFAVTRA